MLRMDERVKYIRNRSKVYPLGCVLEKQGKFNLGSKNVIERSNSYFGVLLTVFQEIAVNRRVFLLGFSAC